MRATLAWRPSLLDRGNNQLRVLAGIIILNGDVLERKHHCYSSVENKPEEQRENIIVIAV